MYLFATAQNMPGPKQKYKIDEWLQYRHNYFIFSLVFGHDLNKVKKFFAN